MLGNGWLRAAPAAKQPGKPEPSLAQCRHLRKLDEFAADQRKVGAVVERGIVAAREPFFTVPTV